MAWLGGSYSDLAGDLSNKKKSKSSSNLLNFEPDELDKGTVSRLKNATKLSENEMKSNGPHSLSHRGIKGNCNGNERNMKGIQRTV